MPSLLLRLQSLRRHPPKPSHSRHRLRPLRLRPRNLLPLLRRLPPRPHPPSRPRRQRPLPRETPRPRQRPLPRQPLLRPNPCRQRGRRFQPRLLQRRLRPQRPMRRHAERRSAKLSSSAASAATTIRCFARARRSAAAGRSNALPTTGERSLRDARRRWRIQGIRRDAFVPATAGTNDINARWCPPCRRAATLRSVATDRRRRAASPRRFQRHHHRPCRCA